MSVSVGLEIVIALAALFWLLAMVASYIVEAFNSVILNTRAKALERFVCEMVLGDGKALSFYKKFKGKLAAVSSADPLGLLSHGQVESLRKPQYFNNGQNTPPSYIPAAVFARA